MKLKNLVIALVLNLFALPGAGQWYLKHKKRALFFIVPVLTGLGFLFYDLTIAVQAVLHTAHMKDHTAQAMALAQDIMPNQEPYLIGFFLLVVVSSLDVVWIFLSQVDDKKIGNP